MGSIIATVSRRRGDGDGVYVLPPTLDKKAATALARAAGEASGHLLIIDFSLVEQIDSAGILGLVQAAESSPGCRLVLAALNAYATSIAHITCLHDVFEIFATVDAAREFAAPSQPNATKELPLRG
jgi:anti-anti-sigma regulatory factor